MYTMSKIRSVQMLGGDWDEKTKMSQASLLRTEWTVGISHSDTCLQNCTVLYACPLFHG